VKISLQPIYHRDGYTTLVENQIVAYFRDVLFEPLFDLVSDAGIKVRENALEDWIPFPRSCGSLGIPRRDMPQIRGAARQEMARFLERRGIKHAEFAVSVHAVRPTQDSYSPAKVQEARPNMMARGIERPIIISADNQILDGHHQWMAALIERPAGKIRVLQFEAPILVLIREAFRCPGVTRENEIKERDPQHSAVWDALAAGVIWYAHGVFTGVFDAAISRELRALGARRVGVNFALAVDELPLALRGVIAMSIQRSELLHQSVLATLDAIEVNLPQASTGLVFTDIVDNITDDLQEQLVQSVSSVEGLPAPSQVPPGLPETLRETLAVDTNRAIKNFSLEATQQLRAKVQANVTAGGRTDRLAKVIEAEFGVAKRRARFIADQETSLLVSKFREERYRDLGATEYVWDTSHDEKVRHDHRELDGKTFSWDNPPITNRATGARNHPGEDFNCRCVARPKLNCVRLPAAA
jgi:SPP1 gp7 family putative phage head morphogenesis protein